MNNIGQTRFSGSKAALLQSYLQGQINQAAKHSRIITARPPDQAVPLSWPQEQLWRREQASDIPPLYNEVITVCRRGALDVRVLEQCFAEIIRRHEIWRTTYDIVNGMPIQVIHSPPARCPLPVIDLRTLPEGEMGAETRRLTSEDAQRHLNLKDGPLFRATLFRTGDTAYQLSLIVHLSIVDGISAYQVFPSELAVLYAAFSAGKPSPLPDLAIQYGDYAYWQRQASEEHKSREQLIFWRKRLAGQLPVLQWPTDHSRPASNSYRGAIRSFTFCEKLSVGLHEFSAQEGITLFTILMTGFSSLLHCYTHQVDFIIGTFSPAGRKRSEVQDLLGYFLNPVPVRVNLEGDPSFRDLLKRIQAAVAEAISHDDVPLEILTVELATGADPVRNPLFKVAISLQPKTPTTAEGWHVTSMDADCGGAPWDLYLAFIDDASSMMGRAQYNPDLFETRKIATLFEDLQPVLNAITAHPEWRISKLFRAT